MTQFDQKYNGLLLKYETLDHKTLEKMSLEDFLVPMSKILKMEIETVSEYLGCPKEMDEEIMQIARLLNAVELMHMHFDFTVEVMKTSSAEEVEALKQKYHLIKHHYGKINTQEDCTPVLAKQCVGYFYETMILELLKLNQLLFKKDGNGEIEFVRNRETYAKLRIMIHRYENGDLHFPMIITFDKEDIFNFERSSPVWQDLYESATFKQLITKDDIKTSFKVFHTTLHVGHLLLTKQRNPSDPKYKTLYSDIKDILYYAANSSKAQTEVLLHLLDARIEEAFSSWNLTDIPLLAKLTALRTPKTGTDEVIYVPRLFPAITGELIQKEYEDDTHNKFCPMEPSQLIAPSLGTRKKVIEELFVQNDNKIPIRILALENLNIRNMGDDSLIGGESEVVKSQKPEKAVVIHIHGGGFVSMSSAGHRVYLKRWVNNLELVHFSIDYRLAPKDPYPAGLDDIWQAYLWIMNYSRSVLGINSEKVIITGDSAGGNLAMALTLRLVRAGVKAPHGCLLIYPCLSVDGNSSSPSYFTSLDDPLLPYTILKMVAKAYVPKGFKNLEDPFISPMNASDDLLSRCPPIRIITGSNDPLHDDTWRLLLKLRKLKKDVKMIVHEHLSHGYMSHQDLKNYELIIRESGDIMKELIAIDQ